MAAPKRKASARKKPATKRTPVRAKVAMAEISPCLWFDTRAEEAARFYVSVFKRGRIKQVARYPAVGQEIHGKPAGSVMTVEFVLNGVTFLALNGGPQFKFSEAVSMQVLCTTQAEIDYYWEALSEGGDPSAQACGWLKDKFGLSWQVSPRGMGAMLKDATSPRTQRAFAAMMKMKKLDIARLKAAYKG